MLGFGGGSDARSIQEVSDTPDQFLGLKRLPDQFVGLHSNGTICHGFVHHARHQNHGRLAELRILLDLAANRITVLIGHNHVGNDHIGMMLFELGEGGGCIGAGDHVDVFAAKRDLDDFAHGGAVVNEVHGGSVLCLGCAERWRGDGLAHCASLSASSSVVLFVASSYSRIASSIRSVAERSTVRWVDVAP